MRRQALGRWLLLVALCLPLGACFEILANPPNNKPTALDDSRCAKALFASDGETVGYGCLAKRSPM
jgi:hypothetical protein